MTAVVRLRGAGLTYPGPPPVAALRPTDLTVHKGSYVAVMGPSGSGKSTLLNVVGLLDRPTTGEVELDGRPVRGLTGAQRCAVRGRAIGFVFQSYHLLPHRDATGNVAMAQLYGGTPRRERLAGARAALGRVGLGARLDALPAQLSGGERQRVAIARAVVHRPSLLLCDEPTGNLDTVTAAGILGLLDELHGDGMTVMVITHDPAVAARAERTITIRDGALVDPAG